MMTFKPDSPLGALERFFLGTSQPEDAEILYRILFDADGNMTDPHHLGDQSLDHRLWTDAVCEHYGLTRKQWDKVVPLVFGERAEEESPTDLLAFLTAYDALAGTSHLSDESNCCRDDEYLWHQEPEGEL